MGDPMPPLRGPQSQKGSAHRARLRFQLCKEGDSELTQAGLVSRCACPARTNVKSKRRDRKPRKHSN